MAAHLDEREPELRLAEHLDVEHVEDEDQDECHEREDPLWNNLQSRPVVEVEGHGRDVAITVTDQSRKKNQPVM